MSTQFYIGIVEDRFDPLKLGRYRVRVFGVHTESLIDIPTNRLPWAIPLSKNASMSSVGLSSNFVEGSLVYVFFQDEESKQLPIIVGSIAGVPIDKKTFPGGTVFEESLAEIGNYPESVPPEEPPLAKDEPILGGQAKPPDYEDTTPPPFNPDTGPDESLNTPALIYTTDLVDKFLTDFTAKYKDNLEVENNSYVQYVETATSIKQEISGSSNSTAEYSLLVNSTAYVTAVWNYFIVSESAQDQVYKYWFADVMTNAENRQIINKTEWTKNFIDNPLANGAGGKTNFPAWPTSWPEELNEENHTQVPVDPTIGRVYASAVQIAYIIPLLEKWIDGFMHGALYGLSPANAAAVMAPKIKILNDIVAAGALVKYPALVNANAYVKAENFKSHSDDNWWPGSTVAGNAYDAARSNKISTKTDWDNYLINPVKKIPYGPETIENLKLQFPTELL